MTGSLPLCPLPYFRILSFVLFSVWKEPCTFISCFVVFFRRYQCQSQAKRKRSILFSCDIFQSWYLVCQAAKLKYTWKGVLARRMLRFISASLRKLHVRANYLNTNNAHNLSLFSSDYKFPLCIPSLQFRGNFLKENSTIKITTTKRHNSSVLAWFSALSLRLTWPSV